MEDELSELEALDDTEELSELDSLDEKDDDSEELKLLDSDELADSLDDTEDDSDELSELETLELSLLDSLDENELDSDELKLLDSSGKPTPVTMIGCMSHLLTRRLSRWMSVSCCVTRPLILLTSEITLSMSLSIILPAVRLLCDRLSEDRTPPDDLEKLLDLRSLLLHLRFEVSNQLLHAPVAVDSHRVTSNQPAC